MLFWLFLPCLPIVCCNDILSIVNLTNYYRSLHGSLPLDWSTEMERSAKSWANQLSASCILKHSVNNAFGENLAGSSSLICNWRSQIKRWYDEIKLYKFTKTPYLSNHANFEKIGHFTATIWRSTTKMGCGVAIAPKSKGCPKGMAIYVCQYSVAGNRGSDASYLSNVLPLQKV